MTVNSIKTVYLISYLIRKRRKERSFPQFSFFPEEFIVSCKMAVPRLCDHPVNKTTFVWSKGGVIIVAPLFLTG